MIHRKNGKMMISAMIWNVKRGDYKRILTFLIVGLILSFIVLTLSNRLLTNLFTSNSGDMGAVPVIQSGVRFAVFCLWVRILTWRVDSEWQDREERQEEQDRRHGRLTDSNIVLKRFAGDEAGAIPMGRFGVSDYELTSQQVDQQLVGIHQDTHKGHIMVIAPTQSGKGLQLTKTLERWPYAAMVIDPKGEQYSRLAGKIYSECISVPAQSVPLVEWYGLDSDNLTPEVSNNLRVLYQNLVRPDADSGDAFWYKMGEPLLKACWKYAKTCQANPIRIFFDMALSRPAEALTALYEVAPEEVNQFAPTLENIESNKMIMSGWQTLVSRLSAYQDMIDIIAPTDDDQTIPAGVMEERNIVFITFDFPTMEAQNGLVSAILAGVTMYHQRRNTKHPLLMAIDELPTVAPKRLPSDLATLTSYGVRYLLYVQNIPQLVEAYGESGKDNMLGNCRHQLYYSPNDEQTAAIMSKLAGKQIHTSTNIAERLEDDDTHKTTVASRSERLDQALTIEEALRMDKTRVLMQLDGQYTVYANRINIIPSLIAGVYGETPPQKRQWRERKVWTWTKPKKSESIKPEPDIEPQSERPVTKPKPKRKKKRSYKDIA